MEGGYLRPIGTRGLRAPHQPMERPVTGIANTYRFTTSDATAPGKSPRIETDRHGQFNLTEIVS